MCSKIRRMKGHNTSSNIVAISLQDHTVTDDQHIADIFASHFSDKSNIPNLPNNSDTNISSPKIFTNTSSMTLPFNLIELNEAIPSLKNSAAGTDDIPSIFLKNLHPDTHLKLLEVYNKIWSQNQFPTLWRQATTIPIKKNDSSSNLLKSYRPISLTCSLCKLLEKMVNKRLLWYLEINNILDPFQTGFRSNRSTMDNLVTLHTDIVNAFSNRSEVIAVTLDIQSRVTATTSTLLQNAINKIDTWSTRAGFVFSASKSKVIHFTKKHRPNPPSITLNGLRLQTVNYLTLFGNTFDKKLIWRQHIQKLKGNCTQRINLLKSLASFSWGADEESLLKIYRALIRSKLDYGSMLYMTSNSSLLKSLNTIKNTSLRLCLGAFKSSPAESLCVESSGRNLQLQ
ncbi:uncharacterized protein [Diabrotica undecimpunctata]|uniref:uncharacterized protein n=1 Tax=Diabrotica undecimpunctata TaxID=50387 RepID=UPI003B631BDA